MHNRRSPVIPGKSVVHRPVPADPVVRRTVPANTFLPDADLVYVRCPTGHSEMVEIAFEDMEPVEMADVVGVEPHAAVALLPPIDLEYVGVAPWGAVSCTPAPAFPRYARAQFEPDSVPTEEFASWELEQESAAAAIG
jgi:hypothetical protein